MQPDPSALIAELKRLSNRELRLTLGQLKPDERTRVLALIEARELPKAAPSFEMLVGLSPWLLRAVDEAKSPADSRRQTPAARAALLSALDHVTAESGTGRGSQKPTNASIVARLLARTRPRAVA